MLFVEGTPVSDESYFGKCTGLIGIAIFEANWNSFRRKNLFLPIDRVCLSVANGKLINCTCRVVIPGDDLKNLILISLLFANEYKIHVPSSVREVQFLTASNFTITYTS